MKKRSTQKQAGRNVHTESIQQRSAQPGQLISFGTYSQTAGGGDQTPIKWRVLENSGKELFLLSEYLLDCKRYYRKYVDITWRDCDLRKWLNHEFYNTAFAAAEKRLIKTARSTDHGKNNPDTKDKVFLLSVAELKRLRETLADDIFDLQRRAVGTEFAKAKKFDGCRLFVYKGKVRAGYINDKRKPRGVSWWWLRSQVRELSRTSFVGIYGSLRSYGRVNLTGYGVRPALRLKIGPSDGGA